MNEIAIPAGMDTKLFVMDKGALKDVPEVLKRLHPQRRPWLVADENTFRAAGRQVQEFLTAAGCVPYPPYCFPGTPLLHPDRRNSQRLAELMPPDAFPVAVGSGVINDLVKCASGIRGVEYCCVPTAASVDGYTSSGAALSVEGTKVTVPCPAPAAVVADTAVLQAAPPEMFASGYADLAAKMTGGSDWLIADAMGLESIRPDIWDMVQRNLRVWLADRSNFGNVFMGLAATGYAMQSYHDSRPASGAEHLMSHVWEMEHLEFGGREISHGFKVGVGTVASCKLQAFILHTPVEEARALAHPLLTETQRREEIRELLKRGCYGNSLEDFAMEKSLFGKAAEERREKIFSVWESLRPKIRKQNFSPESMEQLLGSAGCPIHPEQIGLDRQQFLHGVRCAQLLRKRHTVLDFFYESGLLETAIARQL